MGDAKTYNAKMKCWDLIVIGVTVGSLIIISLNSYRTNNYSPLQPYFDDAYFWSRFSVVLALDGVYFWKTRKHLKKLIMNSKEYEMGKEFALNLAEMDDEKYNEIFPKYLDFINEHDGDFSIECFKDGFSDNGYGYKKIEEYEIVVKKNEIDDEMNGLLNLVKGD